MDKDETTTIADVIDFFYNFSTKREWEKNYSPLFLTKSVVIEAAELLEEFQFDDNESSALRINNPIYKQQISYEIVDVLYYVLMLAKVADIDITESIKEKLQELGQRYPEKLI